VEIYRSDTVKEKPERVNASLGNTCNTTDSYPQATGGYIRVMDVSPPVNPRPAE
jgi:hypothetical protein